MSRKLPAILVLCATLLGLDALAQTKPEIVSPQTPRPATFMFVGNSFFYYNNGLPAHVSLLAAAMPEALRHDNYATMITIGGSGFDWHDMDSYFRPNAVGYYKFDANNNVIFNTRAKFYDAVVMMDCSQCPLHPKLAPIFVDYAKKNAGIVRSHQAEPFLFMSWAYEDHPEMTAALAEAYTKAGNENHELVIPAGLAFARVFKERPDLKLYQQDKRHPSLAGTYLAAATVYSAIYQEPPTESAYTAGLDPELARYLRVTAWSVTRDYYGR